MGPCKVPNSWDSIVSLPTTGTPPPLPAPIQTAAKHNAERTLVKLVRHALLGEGVEVAGQKDGLRSTLG